MGKNSKIEWTDHTFNPWIGCTRVSPGCKNCYAETLEAKRWKRVKWGVGAERKLKGDAGWKEPMKWDKEAARLGFRERVFCASLADVFDEEVLPEWRWRLFDLIQKTPNLDWLLLTKRAEAMHRFMTWLYGPGKSTKQLDNVWLGVSVENQKAADERIPLLLQTPAAVRFLSVEPMLEAVDIDRHIWKPAPGFCDMKNFVGGLDWVICGGESGPGARPFNIQWARDLLAQCRATGVSFFMKQLGAKPVTSGPVPGGPECFGHMDLKNRKGADMAEWPEDLRIREFPKS